MSGEHDRLNAKVRQDIAAGRDGYTAGRDMTVVYQQHDSQTAARREKRPAHDRAVIGQLIKEIADPYDLEVHPSIAMPDSSASGSALPPYIPRAHDRALRRIVKMAQKRSAMAVLVGGSSTGKPVLAGKRYVHSPASGGYGIRLVQRVPRLCGQHSKRSLLPHEQSFGLMKLNFILTLGLEDSGNASLQVCGT